MVLNSKSLGSVQSGLQVIDSTTTIVFSNPSVISESSTALELEKKRSQLSGDNHVVDAFLISFGQ